MRDYLCIGTVAKPQGVKGEIKILPQTDDLARFDMLKRVYFLENGVYREYRVTTGRHDGAFGYLRLEDIGERNAAERLRNREVFVARADAVQLPEGRYFIADLIGCQVQDDQGNPLGVLSNVLQRPGADVYEVRGKPGFLFPALKEVLAQIDVEKGIIVLNAKRLSEVAVYDED